MATEGARFEPHDTRPDGRYHARVTMLDTGCYWARRSPAVAVDEEYVAEEGPEELLSAPEGQFVRVWDGGAAAKDSFLAECSTRLGETLYLGVHDSSEYFQLEVWLAGQRLRGLLYTQDAGWERVLGEALPWETEIVFSEARLAQHRATHGAYDGAAIEDVWQRRSLRAGDRWPMIAASLLAAEVRQRLGLPA